LCVVHKKKAKKKRYYYKFEYNYTRLAK
jgi:hypothetical protein